MNTTNLVAEHRWQSHPGNVQQARHAAREVIRRYAGSGADLLERAIGEACANAVTHGSPRGEADAFTLRCFIGGGRTGLVFEVEDEGHALAPHDVPVADLPHIYSEHGRGLFLISQIMDEVALRQTPRGLNVRMAKHVPLARGAAPP